MKKFKINGKTIGENQRCYIIAEIGNNHEGSKERAKELIKAAADSGADAVSAINTVVGMSIDVLSKQSRLSTVLGGLSGPCIKPIAIACIHKLYSKINIPIIGIGGVSNADDALECMLAGSSLVQIGTMNYKNPNIHAEITKQLSNYVTNNNLKSISSVIGNFAPSK